MDSGNPGARPEPKPDINPKTLPILTTPTYPKPPRLLHRFLFLCLKPEAWAAAARYPFRVTLLPLLLAIFIASIASAIGFSGRVSTALIAFAKTYDANYPTMQINSDGILSLPVNTVQPLHFTLPNGEVYIDTTGKTALADFKDPSIVLFTDRMVYNRVYGVDTPEAKIADRFSYLVPERGAITTINGAMIQQLANKNQPYFIAGFSIFILIANLLWSAFMLFLISPAVSIGAALGNTRLFIPRRPGYRIAAATLVPIVLFSGIIDAVGYSLTPLIGFQNNLLVWFFASAALALWAGILAKQMYLPKPQPKPRRTT